MEATVIDPIMAGRRKTFFRLLFGDHTGYICIALMLPQKKSSFREEFYRYPEDLDVMCDHIESQVLSQNIYFCPQLLRERKRKKETVETTPVAWADLDTCEPDLMLMQPSISIQSSPGRYQAYWKFEEEIDPDDAEEFSKRIAYHHADDGADRSGYDLTQLLRVPYTHNFKYVQDVQVPVVKIIGTGPTYKREDFDKHYKKSPEYFDVKHAMPDAAAVSYDVDELLMERRLLLPPMVWSLFSEEPSDDWSKPLWRLQMLLFEAGFTREEVFAICKEAKCNKYARDGKPLNLLWKEVCRSESKAELHKALLVSDPTNFESLLTDDERDQVERSADTVIERYQQWASKLGDAAPQYHQAGAFIILSSLLSGAIRLPTSYGTIVPVIWFMILADTTLTRKTTAMDIAMDLVSEIDQDVIMATDGSIEGLFTSLQVRPGRPSVFLRDEFSGLLEQMTKKDYMAGMPEMLTKLYDGKMQKRLLRKEQVEVRDPRLIMFCGGIKNKITSLLTFEHVSSGFMPRFVFITAESDLGRVKPIGPPTTRSMGDRDALLAELTDIQTHYNRVNTIVVEKLRTTIEQPMVWDAEMTEDAWVRYNKLENDLLDRGLKSNKPEIMTPVGDRLSKSILKAALLIAAARQRNDGLIIELEDLLRAIKYGEQWHQHAVDVMDLVGQGNNERQLDTILKAIVRNPNGVSRSSLMQAYHLHARDATQIFDTLEQRGMIMRNRVGKTEMLRASNVAEREVNSK